MNSVTHGLILTVIGMGLVFLALVIFLLSMVTLTRLFPGRQTSVKGAATAEATGQSSFPGSSEAEMAAIGAALAIWLKEPVEQAPDPQLGVTLESSPSPWGAAARGTRKGPQ